MKKFNFIFRCGLVVNNYSFISQLLHCIVIFAFIISPCLAHASTSEDRQSNGYEGIVQQPDFLKACVPCFEYVSRSAGPMNIVPEEQKTIYESVTGGRVAVEPIEKDRSGNAKNNPDKPGKKLSYVYIHWVLYGFFVTSILYLLSKNSDVRHQYLFYERLYDVPPENFNYRWDTKKHVWVPKFG